MVSSALLVHELEDLLFVDIAARESDFFGAADLEALPLFDDAHEIRRCADHVLNLFGPERVMVASNWPVILLSGCFAQVWAGLEDVVSGLNATEFNAVMGGTVEKIYGL